MKFTVGILFACAFFVYQLYHHKLGVLMNKIKSFLSVLALSVGFSANAAIVELGGAEVGAFNIDASVASFEDFYALGTVNRYSTALPFAEENTAVFFVGQLNSSLALFGLFDAYSSAATDAGTAVFDYTFNQGTGAYTLIDDPREAVSGSQVSFEWNEFNGDGFVLELNPGNNIDLDAVLTGVTGLDNGFKFLSFDSNNQATDIALASGDFNLSVNVPEPTSIAIMGLSLLG
ncbi:hypothetical protein [Alteromonas confluentis]|uniref:Uncharacterized protein n=1 Tax=Alteromonas confluentis TaxID=1656094 RepID=A0A1E7Z8T8_9ALTE|nr:hypothetical protein [Alteromonas confluentis]OFC69936.1 hypothetical protein BFC18_15905 [Alteromonas confluentis]